MNARATIAAVFAAAALGVHAFSGAKSTPSGSKDLVAHPVTIPTAPIDKVEKARGPDSRTVAEVISGRAALRDKDVTIRAKVVKVTSGILGKNWLHLQDGSGSAAKGTHDLVVTTTDAAAIGEIVNARGKVRVDVAIGPGYSYEVLVEDARLAR